MDSSTGHQLLKSMEELSSTFNQRMTEFEKNLPQPSSKDSSTTVKSLAAEYSTFKTFVWKCLNSLKSQVELLVLSLDRLETHSRRKVLLFHGLKEEKEEDLQKRVLDLFNKQLHISTCSRDEIESCHRLGPKKSKDRPVLVRFASMHNRNLVWKAKTALKGSKVTASEFLTKIRQEVFVAARSHFGIGSCWSMEGSVVILLPDKTRKKIASMTELQMLISQHPSSKKLSND